MSEEVVQRLRELENQFGEITPNIVLRDARKKSSPLHEHFEWNNQKAGHAYRVEQARVLIRSVRVIIHDQTHEIRAIAYVRNPDCDPTHQGYVSTVRVRGNKSKSLRIVARELGYARAALQRAYNVAESLDMKKELERLITKVDKLSKLQLNKAA